MSIPKIIHYCWFGRNPIPERDQKCIASWRKYCPDYQIIQWNEDNYDVSQIPYMKEAYDSQRWGFVPDYARMDIVYRYGGIYLDTDVELIRSLDELLDLRGFAGIEKETNYLALGLGFGAAKGHPFLKELCDIYKTMRFIDSEGHPILKTNPQIVSEHITMHYPKALSGQKNEVSDSFVIFPTEYFCPQSFETGITNLTVNTFSIHHYHASWKTEEELKNMDEYRKTTQIFGKKLGEIVFGIYSCIKAEGLGCYLWNRIRKYIRKIIETN